MIKKILFLAAVISVVSLSQNCLAQNAEMVNLENAVTPISAEVEAINAEQVAPQEAPAINEATGLHPRYDEILGTEGTKVAPEATDEAIQEVADEKTAPATEQIPAPKKYTTPDFKDVNENTKFYAEIKDLQEKGILFGYPDALYRPDDLITRAEFSSIITRALKIAELKVEPMNFTDIDNHWAYNYMQVAANKNLLKGQVGGEFKPEDTVPRIEVMAVMTSALNTHQLTQDQVKTLLSTYKDANSIPAWLVQNVAQAINLDLVVDSEKGNGYLAPLEPATRAEFAAFISRMLNPKEQLPKARLGLRLYEGESIGNAYTDGKYAVVPAGTPLNFAIIECTQDNPASEDSNFKARARKNFVTVDKKLVIPAGSAIYGKFREAKKARLFRSNVRYILETEIVESSKTGQKIPMMATAVVEPKYNGKNIFDKISFYIIKGKKMNIHKSATGTFILLQPYRVQLIDEWVTL
ncbi:S-layer homology domain-containing protein [bacterium]|nr:S-layer homology domain-containing protein [bacterium]